MRKNKIKFHLVPFIFDEIANESKAGGLHYYLCYAVLQTVATPSLERICWEEVVYGKQGCGDGLRLVTPTFIIFFLQTYFARLIHEDYVLLR